MRRSSQFTQILYLKSYCFMWHENAVQTLRTHTATVTMSSGWMPDIPSSFLLVNTAPAFKQIRHTVSPADQGQIAQQETVDCHREEARSVLFLSLGVLNTARWSLGLRLVRLRLQLLLGGTCHYSPYAPPTCAVPVCTVPGGQTQGPSPLLPCHPSPCPPSLSSFAFAESPLFLLGFSQPKSTPQFPPVHNCTEYPQI